jgi:hypothetical protein
MVEYIVALINHWQMVGIVTYYEQAWQFYYLVQFVLFI